MYSGQTESSRSFLSGSINRRQFLSKSRDFLLASSLAAMFTSSGLREQREVLRNLGSRVVMLDFAPNFSSSLFSQSDFPDVKRELQRILGDQYIDPRYVAPEFTYNKLKDWLRTTNDTKSIMVSKYGGRLLFSKLLQEYSDHGLEVANVYREILQSFGAYSLPTIIPLQKAINSQDVRILDPFGEVGFTLNLSPDYLIEKLKNTPQRIVNLSFQLGYFKVVYKTRHRFFSFDKYQQNIKQLSEEYALNRVHLLTEPNNGVGVSILLPRGKEVVQQLSDTGAVKFFELNPNNQLVPLTDATEDGELLNEIRDKLKEAHRASYVEKAIKPIIQILSPYNEDISFSGLEKLCKLARAYPDKLINAALGNYGDNISETRRRLSEAGEWPNNLLIWGEYNEDLASTAVYGRYERGADIYVSSECYPTNGTSLATVFGSALCSLLDASNLSVAEIKDVLMACTEAKLAHVEPTEIRFSALDQQVGPYIRKVKNHLRSEGKMFGVSVITPQSLPRIMNYL